MTSGVLASQQVLDNSILQGLEKNGLQSEKSTQAPCAKADGAEWEVS